MDNITCCDGSWSKHDYVFPKLEENRQEIEYNVFHESLGSPRAGLLSEKTEGPSFSYGGYSAGQRMGSTITLARR